MPVNINNILQTGMKPTFNPKYFNKDLTGTGGLAGLFNQKNSSVENNIKSYINPVSNQLELSPSKHLRTLNFESGNDDFRLPSNITNNHTLATSRQYDLSPLNILSKIEELTSADSTTVKIVDQLPEFINKMDTTELGHNQNGDAISVGVIAKNVDYQKLTENTNPQNFYENFFINNALIIKVHNDNNKKVKITSTIDVSDLMTNYIQPNQADEVFIINNFDIYSTMLDDNYYETRELRNQIQKIRQTYQIPFSMQDVKDVIEQIDFVKLLTTQAKLNHEYLFTDLAKLFQFYDNESEQFYAHRLILSLSYKLTKIEEDQHTDQDYANFYHDVKNASINNTNLNGKFKYNGFLFSKLLSINTRLSLTHELFQLKNSKNVHKFQPTKPFQSKQKYSNEQLAVIKTTEPYSVVVAGAGSGKSHTLLGRLTYLVENGVDLKNVLVTSFTNTAAQNIIDRFKGGINSLTNANLFHKIYQTNFDHELINDDTIVNMLNIITDASNLMQKTPTIKDTKQKLTHYLSKTVNQGFKRVDLQEVTENLIGLINERLDDVLTILNGTSKTSLLLEPIIINALMQNQVNIKYPDNLSNLDYIITDESQDTSTFEYVLLLQLAKRNNAQMMIIGDANQTLYEFRNANPDFLNALERSETFKTYTMATNYRSQQSILTLTNQFLNILKTNQTSKIKLHSNKYTNLDEHTFRNNVKLANLVVKPKTNTNKAMKNEITDSILQRQDITDWVINEYKNNHQIAIMAFRNNDTQAIGDAVAKIIIDNFGTTPTVGFTRKEQARNNTWLSEMLSKTQDPQFEKLARNHQINLKSVYQSLINRLQVIADGKYYNKGQINDWAKTQVTNVVNSAYCQANLNDLLNNKMSFKTFMGRLTMTLISIETRKNNMNRVLQSQMKDTDWQNADIVVSTIHSAKGLEFDSVICYYDETMKRATSQETLRLYGVALTRAKNKELIINRPKTQSNSTMPTNFGYNDSDMFKTPMRTAYARVVQELHNKVNP